MYSWVHNKAILLLPFPSSIVKLSPPHHTFSIIVPWNWHTSSWEAIWLVPTALKHIQKRKSTSSTWVVHFTKMMTNLVLVRMRVNLIIYHLCFFYQIYIDGVTKSDKNIFFFLTPNFINHILLQKKITWIWFFHITHCIVKVAHIKAVVIWISAIPSFIYFLQHIYFRYYSIAWCIIICVVGEGQLVIVCVITTATTLKWFNKVSALAVLRLSSIQQNCIIVHRHVIFFRSPINKKELTRIMWQDFWLQLLCRSHAFKFI